MEKIEINGRNLSVVGRGIIVDENGEPTGETIPMIEMSSDYSWFLFALDSRLKKPELYGDEDIENEKQKIKQFLLEHTTYEAYNRYFDKYKDCFDFIYNNSMEVVA